MLVEPLRWRALLIGFPLLWVSHGLLLARFWKASLRKSRYDLVREICEEGALQLGIAKCGAMNVNADEGRKGEGGQVLGIIYSAVAGETVQG